MSIPTVSEVHPDFGIPIEYVPAGHLRDLMPRVSPFDWVEVETGTLDSLSYVYEPRFGRRFKVLLSACREKDGRLWLHVSLSKWNQAGTEMQTPNWEDIRLVKDLFVGREREAYIVLPPADRYVNLKEVHHLWSCLDGPVLPDFTQGTRSI